MAKDWDYSEHSHKVSLAGGPLQYDKTLLDQGYAAGYKDGYSDRKDANIGNLAGAILFTIGVGVGIVLKEPCVEVGKAAYDRFKQSSFGMEVETFINKHFKNKNEIKKIRENKEGIEEEDYG